MSAFRNRAGEFIETLRRENAESQTQIDKIGSDVTDREIELLKHDISSRERTIARLEEELRDSP